jgi:hypothetical protein
MERATVTLETERAKWPNLDVYDDDDEDDFSLYSTQRGYLT